MGADLPGILGEFAALIGDEKARAIAQKLGGQYVSIPRTPSADSTLAKVIGVEAARKIAREFGHGQVVIPMGSKRRDLQIKKMLLEHVPHNRIAAAVGCTVRAVEYHAARMGEADDRQGVLPLDGPATG